MGKMYREYPDEIVPDMVSEPEMLYAIRKNTITTDYLERLKAFSGLKDGILAEALNLSLKTLSNYKGASIPMKPYLQEHVLALLSLYKHGYEVFGDIEPFNSWLQTKNPFFDNDTPISFFTTISGIRFINDRLTAIAYGDNV